MNLKNKVLPLLLAFLLSLFAFGTILALIMSLTFSSPDFMIKVLKNHKYYDSIHNEYCVAMEDLAIPAGIDEGVFSSLIKKSDFKNDINKIIYSAYSDKELYGGTMLEDKKAYTIFYDSMLKTADDKGIKIDNELKIGIDNVANLCAATYENYVTVPFVDIIGNFGYELNSYFKLSAVICFVMTAALTFALIVTDKWKNYKLHIITISAISVGLMLTMAPLLFIISGKIRHLSITTRSLYDFAVGYIESFLLSFIISGLAILAVTLISWLFRKYNVIDKIKHK